MNVSCSVKVFKPIMVCPGQQACNGLTSVAYAEGVVSLQCVEKNKNIDLVCVCTSNRRLYRRTSNRPAIVPESKVCVCVKIRKVQELEESNDQLRVGKKDARVLSPMRRRAVDC